MKEERSRKRKEVKDEVKKLNESNVKERRNEEKFLKSALIYLSAVHEIQQASHVIAIDVGHEQDRMCWWMLDKNLLKVRTAHRQNLNEEISH